MFIVKPTSCTIPKIYFILEQHSTCFGRSLRLRSLRLYIQHKVYVIQVLWLLGSKWPSEKCRVLFQNKPNFRYCGSGWFYYRNAYFMYEPITYRSLLALCANCICDFLRGSASWYCFYEDHFWSACVSLMFCEFVVVADICSVCSLVAVGLLTNVGRHLHADDKSSVK
jgi:hypothetical protein